MVFTYNIGNGLTAGLLIYPVVKLLAGRIGDVRPGGWVLAAACAVYYIFGLPH
jgi:AGZA family xanthine/uracil permease-like MFS transporter